MRAILIDPRFHSVTEVDYDGDYKDINRKIGADLFDVVRMGDEQGHAIYVDDEGLINGKQHTHGMFRVQGDFPAYLAGPGLILATDREGESVAATLSLAEVREMVQFGVMVRLHGGLVFAETKADGTGFTGRFFDVE